MSPHPNTPAVCIGVLLVNYHSSAMLAECVRSIFAHAGDVRLLLSIVDNSRCNREARSVELMAAECRARGINVTVTIPEDNLGYGGGLNAAWDALAIEPDIVIAMNPDVRILSGSLAHLVGLVAADEMWSVRTESRGSLLTGQAAMTRWSSQTRQLRVGEHPNGDLVYPGGHFLVMRRELWCAVGGMSPSLFLYCEEIDLLLRARQGRSIKLRVSGEVLIEHVGAATTSSQAVPSTAAAYHATFSRVVAYRTHSELRAYMPTMLAARALVAVKFAAMGRWDQATSALKGMRDGLRRRSP